MNDRLIVRGAREHNLKNVSLDMPRNSLIVFTDKSKPLHAQIGRAHV